MWVMHWENILKSLLADPSNWVFSHKENSPHDTNFPLWAECSVKACGSKADWNAATNVWSQACPLAMLSGQAGFCAYAGSPHMALAPLASPACSNPTPSKPMCCLSFKIWPLISLLWKKWNTFFYSKVWHHNKHHDRGLSNAQNRNIIWVKTETAPLIWDLGERYERH